MKIHYQGIKRFAFSDSAPGVGSLPAEEGWNRTLCRGAGRPICSGEKREISINGGHKENEIMKRHEKTRGGEPLGLSGMTMLKIAFYILKPFGIGINEKVLSQLEVI